MNNDIIIGFKTTVDPLVVQGRHPVDYAKIVSKLGGAPTSMMYQAKTANQTEHDFQNEVDFRNLIFANNQSNIISLMLFGTLNGKTVKTKIDHTILLPAQYPLELCGADPADRISWPSLWLKDVHGDKRYLGWTEWKLAGLHRRLKNGQPTSPWMANLVRRNDTALLNEGFLNANELHTIHEANELAKDMSSAEGGKYRNIKYYIFGETYWDAFTNTPGGTIGKSAKDLAKYEFVGPNHPVTLDWIERHCQTINNLLYPQTLSFVAPNNEQHLSENSSIGHSVELMFAWQRGEKTFQSPLGTNPEKLLKQGHPISGSFF